MKPTEPDIKLVKLPGRKVWHLRWRRSTGEWSTASFCGINLDYFGARTWNPEVDGEFDQQVCEKCAAQSLAQGQVDETN